MALVARRRARPQRREHVVCIVATAICVALAISALLRQNDHASFLSSSMSPTNVPLRFHAIARNQSDAVHIAQSFITQHPCQLFLYSTHPLTATPAAGACNIRERRGTSWTDVLFETHNDILVERGANVSDEAIAWLLSARHSVQTYENEGGRREYTAIVASCNDDETPCLVLPWAFWPQFTSWYSTKRAEWAIYPHIASEFYKIPNFRRSRSNKKRDPNLTRIGNLVGRRYPDVADMWTIWYTRWLREYQLKMLVDKDDMLPDPWVTLEDDPVLDAIKVVVHSFVDEVAITIVDSAFLELTLSWLCNVRTAGFLPPNIVWLTLDDSVRRTLDDTDVGVTVDLSAALWGTQRTEILYGHRTYWHLMLIRTRLISELLNRGVDVFLFETDQVWLQDPLRYMQREIDLGADMVGTLDTQHNIAGNTLFLRSVLATRKMWSEVYIRFKASYDSVGVDHMPESEKSLVEHDQYSLSDLLLYNVSFIREFPVALALMNADLFVGGSWYTGFYSSEESKRPVVINNNFVSGVAKKKKRAMTFGHWFLDNYRTCMPDAVQKALQYELVNK